MAGHSKWSQIKHKKAVVDAKRSKEFSKIARLISVESRLCGGDLSSPSLKALVEKAKSVNMPKENIERAIQKGAGLLDGNVTQTLYELYGPGGVAVLVSVTTNNTNRTVQEIKHILSTLGYSLADPGSALWAFSNEGGAWGATTQVDVSEEDTTSLVALIDALLEHDDVDDVLTNAQK